MNRRFSAALVVLVAAIPLVACSEKTGGSATSTEGATTPTGAKTTTAEPGGDDLDTAKYLNDPCAILKTDQVAALGNFKRTDKDALPLGESCSWVGKDPLVDSTYAVTFSKDGNTVDSIAGNAKNSPVFQEVSVAGRKAVSYDTTDGKRDCTTAVGTSADGAVVVQVNTAKNDTANNGKACAASEKLAAVVIGNLKG